MYNTETATQVAEWDNGRYSNDFNHCSETLYKKTTGEFFLHGSGGANSIYSKSNGNSAWGSSQIIPLSEDEARKWVESRCDGGSYEDIFGTVEE